MIANGAETTQFFIVIACPDIFALTHGGKQPLEQSSTPAVVALLVVLQELVEVVALVVTP